MIEKEIIFDRIKGCLTAVALSDALNNLKLTTGRSYASAFKFNSDYREEPIPEQYLPYVKGKNTTDRYLFVGFNGSPTMPPSNMMRALIDCIYALIKWKEDLRESGNYVDPEKYIYQAIDKSSWNYDLMTPLGFRMCWSTALAVGILGSWLFDFSEDIDQEIKVIATHPLLNLHLNDEEAENARLIWEERTHCGIFAAVIRNLIVHPHYVDVNRYLAIVIHCALRNYWGDKQICDSIGLEAQDFACKMSIPGNECLFQILDWKSHNSIEKGSGNGRLLYGGIRYSAILGSVHGYDSFPYKDMLKYVEVIPEVEKLMTLIKTKFLN